MTLDNSNDWGSDVPVSAPLPKPGIEQMEKAYLGGQAGGLVMTPQSLAYDLTVLDLTEDYVSRWRATRRGDEQDG